MNCCLRVGLTAVLITAAPLSFAANLVPNPDFTQLLTGWSPAPGSATNMEADFSTGSPAQPSAHVSGYGTPASAGIIASCIPADDLSSVTLSFNARVVAGVARGAISSYSDAACTNLIDSVPTEDAPPSEDWTPVAVTIDALAPGTQSIAVSLHADSIDGVTNGNAYFDHVAFGAAGSLQPAIPIDQEGLSGAWYNPDASGQGFQFSIDPTGRLLFGAWYTFDTIAGGADSQRWYTLVASPSSDDISADVTIYRNVGGRFAAPPQTSATPVGTGTLVFDSCMSGAFAYTFDDGRAGTIPLRTATPMVACAETGTPNVQPGPFGLSGAWYDPTTAGQGALVSVDAFTGTVFVGWYTYTAGGASGPEGQRWFTVQGSYGVGGPIALGVYASTGGVFDADGAATTEQVGTATLDFDSCEHATLDYTFTTGDLAGTSGALDLARLGNTPAGCALTTP